MGVSFKDLLGGVADEVGNNHIIGAHMNEH